MNRLTKNTLIWIAAIVVAIGMKYAGNWEYQEEVISSISQELYCKILQDLGGTASEKDICDTYIANKERYDSLGI